MLPSHQPAKNLLSFLRSIETSKEKSIFLLNAYTFLMAVRQHFSMKILLKRYHRNYNSKHLLLRNDFSEAFILYQRE